MNFFLFVAVSSLVVVAQAATVKEAEDSSHKHNKRHLDGASIDAGSIGATYPAYANSLTASGFDQASSLLTKDSTSITSAEFANTAGLEAAPVAAALPAAEYAPAFSGVAAAPAFSGIAAAPAFTGVAAAPAFAAAPAPVAHEGRLIHVSKDIYIKNRYAYPVSQPYPVTVEKPVPYPVLKTYPVKVDKPYPVHVPKPYPVPVEKPVPYNVDKPVPYPVPVKVPYPVVERVPVHIPKAIPIPMIRRPVCVQSKSELVPLSGYSGLAGVGTAGFASGFGSVGVPYTGAAAYPYSAGAAFPATF